MNNYFSTASSEEAVLRQRQENLREEERRDASLDEALGFTFPASDPVALNCPFRALLASRREHVQVSIDFFKRAWQKSRS
jgi:hypothetical protein